MNTTNETSKLTSLTTTMAPTTTFSKSTKKGLAVLVALCMLSFYTGHLSRGGEQLSNVSLLRNGVLESGGVTTTNGISDSGGVTTTNGKVKLNRLLLMDDEGNFPVKCRAKGYDCALQLAPYYISICEGLKECPGCTKDSDCEGEREGSCVKTDTDPRRPASTYTMCVIPEECRVPRGRPADAAFMTCGGVDAWEETDSSPDSGYYNNDCCDDKECVTVPASIARQHQEYNYCGDICIKKKNCDRSSAHTREAQCGESDACCSDDFREQKWKLNNGDTCQPRTGKGGACKPGDLMHPNCDCAPRGGVCRFTCDLERAYCTGFLNCPNETCCVGGKCNPFFEKNNIYTE